MNDRRSQSGWHPAWIAGAGALIALPFVLQQYISYRTQAPSRWSWPRAYLLEILYWYLWAAFLPLVRALIRRFPCERPHLLRRVGLHILGSLVLAVLFVVLYIGMECPLEAALGQPCELLPRLRINLTSFFMIFAVVLYWLFWFVIQMLEYRQRYRDQELKVSQLESQLMRAQLQALKMQLNPHFLFNTLHAISALMYHDVGAADRMISRMSDLLRVSLALVGQQEVALLHELDFLKGYLEIEQARLGERLTVHLEIDPSLLDAIVPNLILQPLVENAVRHGVASRLAPGTITVRARREGTQLVLQVIDDGPRIGAGPLSEGIGLSNTRARLQRLYGQSQRFELREAHTGGLEVTVGLPLQLGGETGAEKG